MKQIFLILATFLLVITIPPHSVGDFDDDREWMVKTQIDAEGITDGRIGVKNKSVLEAMRSVPRHEFVPDRLKSQALYRHAVADRVRPDNFATVYRCIYDRTA